MHHHNPVPSARLYFLDWVRILAFFLLIVYHVGMYYVTWGWHVKSPFASTAAEPFMMLSSPWRLGLLFFIGGVAASLMLRKSGTGSFLKRRSVRLLVPLIFGMFVIVPPQSYFEVVEKLGYTGGYGDFMTLYVQGYKGFCQDGCLKMPTWNHLWFVAYLWIYTMLLGGLVAVLGPRLDRIAAQLGKLLHGWKLIALPAAVLAVARIALVERFETNHAVVNDWCNHAMSFLPFLLGALVARVPGFWSRPAQVRWQALAIAATCWTLWVMWAHVTWDNATPAAVAVLRPIMYSVYALMAWTATVAACGFAVRHLDHDGPARRYLNEAIFPVYILHQTLIVVLAHAMKPLRIAPGPEAIMLVVLTTTLSFGIFELVRRVRFLRPLFGLAPIKPEPAAQLPLKGTVELHAA